MAVNYNNENNNNKNKCVSPFFDLQVTFYKSCMLMGRYQLRANNAN